MSHFLEHVPSIKDVRRIILSGCKVASEFVLIQQPYFDADPYLFDLGLKTYWSHWWGHTNHMTRLEMLNSIDRAAAATEIKRYYIGARYPIASSDAPEILPLLAPAEQVEWSSEKHGSKASVPFAMPVFRELFAIILTGHHEPSPELTKYMSKRGGTVFFDSAKNTSG
jgi:hypothetical protein